MFSFISSFVRNLAKVTQGRAFVNLMVNDSYNTNLEASGVVCRFLIQRSMHIQNISYQLV